MMELLTTPSVSFYMSCDFFPHISKSFDCMQSKYLEMCAEKSNAVKVLRNVCRKVKRHIKRNIGSNYLGAELLFTQLFGSDKP